MGITRRPGDICFRCESRVSLTSELTGTPLIHSRAQVVATTFVPSTANPYADASSCSITFVAPVTPALLRRNDNAHGVSWVDCELVLMKGNLVLGFLPDVPEEIDIDESNKGIPCLTLLLGDGEENRTRALVLRQTQEDVGNYIRIGMMRGEKDDYKDYGTAERVALGILGKATEGYFR
jgi:hypothetical protein